MDRDVRSTGNIFVSVIMTVYKDEVFLEEAIESILNQSYGYFELIIIIEYGSDEKTKQIVNKYRISDSRIVVINNEVKLGFASSLNRGLELAKGKYIFRMDGDDISDPNRMMIQINFMENHPELILCGGDTEYIFQDEKKDGEVVNYPRTTQDIRNAVLFYVPFAHPTICFNRCMIDRNNIRYANDYRAEDYELWSRLVFGFKTANIPRVLLKYRIHSNNSTSVFSDGVAESENRLRANIIRGFLSDFSNECFNLNSLKNDEDLRYVENILLRLFSDYKEVFTSPRYLRRKMREIYLGIGKDIVKNPFQRYWNTFRRIEDKSIIRWFNNLLYFKYHEIKLMIGKK